MTKVIYLFLISVCLSFVTSCTPDPCKNVTCENGTCTTGTCECENGYEGSTCATEVRAKFLGNWNGTAAGSSGTAALAMNITAGSSLNQVVINNMFFCSNVSIPTYGTVSGNSIQVINPITCAGSTLTFSSVNWTVSGNVMSFTLNINNGAETVVGSATR